MTGKYWTYQINPVAGCTPVSEACKNCYARALHERFHGVGYKDVWDPSVETRIPKAPPRFYRNPFEEVTLRPEQLDKFDKVKAGQVVFVGNMCDLFHEKVPTDYIGQVFEMMQNNPQNTYLVLTKRAQRMKDFVFWYLDQWEAEPQDFRHVWMGVTAENQQRADERIPYLLETPAAHRWISAEPLLGPIDLTKCIRPTIYDYEEVLAILDANGECEPEEFIPLNELTGDYVNDGPELVRNPAWSEHRDWVEWRARTIALKRMLDLVIVGGESSRNGHVRTMNPEWARSIKYQCMMAGVKFYFKQYGTGYCKENNMVDNQDNQVFDGVDYSRLKPQDIWGVASTWPELYK